MHLFTSVSLLPRHFSAIAYVLSSVFAGDVFQRDGNTSFDKDGFTYLYGIYFCVTYTNPSQMCQYVANYMC